MKAFVVAALFVATVAGQGLDLYKYRMDRTHDLFNVDTDDLLLKEKFGRHLVDRDLFRTMDLTTIFGRDTYVLTLDEIVDHPLFHTYMRIPLFRKFMVEHPIVFKKYVESPLFQKFWVLPRFQMYFWNPVLFYKYIVPQLHLIEKVILTRGIYNVDDVFTTKKNMIPFVYNKDLTYKVFNKDLTYDLRFLLHKIIKTLDVDMVRDVLPIDDIKMVDDLKTVVPFVGMDRLFERKDLVKDLLIKKIILTKIFGDRKVLTRDVFDILFNEHKEMIPEVYKYLFNLKDIMTPDVLYTLFNTKKFFIPEIYDTLFDFTKVLHPTLYDIFYKDLVVKKFLTRDIYDILFKGTKDIVTPQILETVFGKKIYDDVVLRTLFGDRVVLPEVFKYDTDLLTDKKVIMNPLVERMIMNRRFSPRMNVMTDKVFDDMDLVRDYDITDKVIRDIKY